MKHTIALCLLLLTAHAAAAQFVCTYRDIITVYSTNGDYCARATPYYNFDLSPYGKTEVFDTRTNQLLYTIPECLSKGFLFLSNDGISVLHLVDVEYKSRLKNQTSVAAGTDPLRRLRGGIPPLLPHRGHCCV